MFISFHQNLFYFHYGNIEFIMLRITKCSVPELYAIHITGDISTQKKTWSNFYTQVSRAVNTRIKLVRFPVYKSAYLKASRSNGTGLDWVGFSALSW